MIGFAGYAAIFDVPDRAGDVVRRGAFAAAGRVPLLWQHRGVPVGEIAAIGEDACGLRVRGTITALELAGLVRAGALTGLSIGYRPRRVRQGTYRELIELDLIEVSLVAQPMQRAARILETLEETSE
nr:HK97 family phage prohead protease [Sphingomonas baiyangensis]